MDRYGDSSNDRIAYLEHESFYRQMYSNSLIRNKCESFILIFDNRILLFLLIYQEIGEKPLFLSPELTLVEVVGDYLLLWIIILLYLLHIILAEAILFWIFFLI